MIPGVTGLLDGLNQLIDGIDVTGAPALGGNLRIAGLMSDWIRHSQRSDYLRNANARGLALCDRLSISTGKPPEHGEDVPLGHPFEQAEGQLRALFAELEAGITKLLARDASGHEARVLMSDIMAWEHDYYAVRSASPREARGNIAEKPAAGDIELWSSALAGRGTIVDKRDRVLTPDVCRLIIALDRSLHEATVADKSVATDLSTARAIAHLIGPAAGYAIQDAAFTVGAEHIIRLDRDTLQSYFRRTIPNGETITVKEARRLSGGYGRATVLVEFDQPVLGDTALVIRAQLPDTVVSFERIDIQSEYQVFRLAHAAGIAAPEPLVLEDGDNETGTKFLIVRKLPGVNYGSVFSASRELSDALIHDLIRVLAQIHSVDIGQHAGIVGASHLAEWAGDGTASASVKRWLDTWKMFWDEQDYPSPILARGFNWLYDNIPENESAPRLLHSDYALGNVLIENDKISGVLDWEQTHLGDPAEEVAWLVTNLRSIAPEEQIVRIYAELTGDHISTERLRFFDVFTAVKIMLCGVGALTKFQKKDSIDGLFCELANFTLAPYAKMIVEAISIAEVGGASTD
ncbi:MAG: phosphotransferase family protein [Novosphingobium sp.]